MVGYIHWGEMLVICQNIALIMPNFCHCMYTYIVLSIVYKSRSALKNRENYKMYLYKKKLLSLYVHIYAAFHFREKKIHFRQLLFRQFCCTSVSFCLYYLHFDNDINSSLNDIFLTDFYTVW
jgi:hypothetical protein